MIIAADWVFPVTSPPLQKHAVVIENDRIREIRPCNPTDPYLDGCILPGLINTHTHLAYTILRNQFDQEPFFSWIRKLTKTKYEVLTEKDFVDSTRLGIYENLRAGITTVADMSDIEASLRILSESPMRGIFYWEVFGVEKEQADKTWNTLPENYFRLKQLYETARLRIGVSPHSCYTVRPELFEKIANWSFAEKIPVSFHVAESKEEEVFIFSREGVIAEFLRERAADWNFLGSSSISHLEKTGILRTRPLVAHAVQASDEDLQILADADVAVSYCPKSNAKFGHGIAPVVAMLDKGVRLGLGSDSAASNNRFDLFEEARFGLLQQRSREKSHVLSEQLMLEMMTIRGAEALGMEADIGSLEPNKFADLIVVKIPTHYQTGRQVLNHLIHNTTANDVIKTVIGGNEVSYEAD
jgi:cytosine/adenosine deaminase-related metal-dependent hydrolase